VAQDQVPVSDFCEQSNELSSSKRSWLKHYATSRKVAGSRPDKVIGYFPHSKRNEYQESSWGKRWPALKTDNLTVMYEPIF
jgi:hypothetical protein